MAARNEPLAGLERPNRLALPPHTPERCRGWDVPVADPTSEFTGIPAVEESCHEIGAHDAGPSAVRRKAGRESAIAHRLPSPRQLEHGWIFVVATDAELLEDCRRNKGFRAVRRFAVPPRPVPSSVLPTLYPIAPRIVRNGRWRCCSELHWGSRVVPRALLVQPRVGSFHKLGADLADAALLGGVGCGSSNDLIRAGASSACLQPTFPGKRCRKRDVPLRVHRLEFEEAFGLIPSGDYRGICSFSRFRFAFRLLLNFRT